MRKKQNDKHQWRRTNHAVGYKNVKSRFQWHEHNTYGDWFYVVHLQQSLITPLEFIEIETKNQVDNRVDKKISEQILTNLNLED
jgi:hypothetical protein